MTTEEAFIAAVIAAPSDDLPRLVYADWLDENGRGNRAGFIRRGIAGSIEEWNCDHWVVDGMDFLVGHPESLPPRATVVITRGFVSEVRCTIAAWTQHGPEVVQRHPVERVVLTDVSARMIQGGGPRGDFVAYTKPIPQKVMDIINRSWRHELQSVESALSALSDALIAWAKSHPAK